MNHNLQSGYTSMKKTIYLIFILAFCTSLYAIDIDFKVFNRAFVYNGENTHWNETIVTMTYFENFTEGSFIFTFNDFISLELGAAIFVPFTLELPDGMRFFPIVRTKLSNEYVSLTIGTLENNHNFPAALMDPLINTTPFVRAFDNNSRMPNGTESYKYGKFTHGYYEYGLAFKWFKGGSGELYMNWQLQHTGEHRERFDVGLTYALNFIETFTPYIGVRYWHNGGHEFPFVPGAPQITENYSGGIGINSKEISILYLASYNIVDRDVDLSQNGFGHGLYIRGQFSVFGWFDLEPSVFVSGFYLNNEHKYISIEADPFFRVPFYLGLNIIKDFEFSNGITLSLNLINGVFLTEENDVGGRYDQGLQFDFTYLLNIKKD